LATIALNIGSVFEALNAHYPERKNVNLSGFAKAGLSTDQWLAKKKSQLTQKSFIETYRSLQKKFDQSAESNGQNASDLVTKIIDTRRRLRKDSAIRFSDLSLANAFVVVSAAIKTITGIELRQTQLLAARAMLNGRLVEMATGEGKTYAATLAAATAALAGIPVHVLTANEYLATRDAKNLMPIYALLGLSCGAIDNEMQREDRRAIYKKDVVYCTASEVIFDYLRDRTESTVISPKKNSLQQRLSHVTNPNTADAPVLRGLCFALIDEADSILIDEASTPFILAAVHKKAQSNSEFTVALGLAKSLQVGLDFTANRSKKAELTESGKATVLKASESLTGLWRQNSRYREELAELALTALYCFKRDVDYVVKDDEIHIVDANTGRIAEGRQWSRGLHQLIQSKESVSESDGQKTLIQLTYQRFFPRYLMMAGMSGTLTESARELSALYNLTVEKIAPFKKCQRIDAAATIFFEQTSLHKHLVEQVKQAHARGQPILIGTDSVQASYRTSQLLRQNKLPHTLLNATEHAKEAEIIANAGMQNAITVATNMAGRGTDVALADGVADVGGLLVISCQANESKRIDRQLSGRSGRRGDPGCTNTLVTVKSGVLAKEVPHFVWQFASLLTTANGAIPIWLGETILRRCQWLHEFKATRKRIAMMRIDEAIEQRLSFGGRKD
jgi:preprotein translocase subunit SecA